MKVSTTEVSVKTSGKAKLYKSLGFLSMIAPTSVIVGLNWESYVSTAPRAFSLGAGGFILITIASLSAVGKMKKLVGSGYTTLWVAFTIVTALQPLIAETQVILASLLAGTTVQKVVFENLFKKEMESLTNKLKEQDMQKQADAFEQAVTNVLEKKWSGRV